MAATHKQAAVDLILGTGSFGTGTTGGSACTGDKVQIQKIIDEFKKRGYNHVDTARNYGDGTSESILAELDYAGQGLIMDTKIPGTEAGQHSAANVKAFVAASLAALKTKKVHTLYLHVPERTTPFEETLAAINEEYKKGYFEKFGISNYSAKEVEEIVRITKEKGFVQPSVYQGMYNLIARAGEAELFPLLRKHNISFYAYSPLAGSFLIGNVPKSQEVEKGSRFDKSHQVGQMYNSLFNKDSLHDAIEKLNKVGKPHGLAIQEISLRWLAHHSQLSRTHGDAIITGGRKLENLLTTLDFLEKGPLPADIVKAVDEVWAQIKSDAPKYHL